MDPNTPTTIVNNSRNTPLPKPQIGSNPIPTKFTPIAPAPAKISYQPAPTPTIMLPQASPNPNLPILTQGPNGTMLLVQNPTPTFTMFPQPQFILPQQLITYGMPTTTFLQPQVQTTFLTSHQHIPQQQITRAEEITIVSQTNASMEQQITSPVKKIDILERAILEIATSDSETK